MTYPKHKCHQVHLSGWPVRQTVQAEGTGIVGSGGQTVNFADEQTGKAWKQPCPRACSEESLGCLASVSQVYSHTIHVSVYTVNGPFHMSYSCDVDTIHLTSTVNFRHSVVPPPLPVKVLCCSYYFYSSAFCRWHFWQNVWLRGVPGISRIIYIFLKVSINSRKLRGRIAENTRFRDY